MLCLFSLPIFCSSDLWIVGLGLGLLGIGWALSIVAPFQVMLASAVCHTCNNVMIVFLTYICSSELWIVGLGLGLFGIGWALSIVAPFQDMLVSAVCHTSMLCLFS